MIIGRLTRPATCCAAALDFTRAEKRTTIASVSARNGGTTQIISTHHDDVGKNHPPTFGPTTRFTISEYSPKPTTVVR